MNPEQRERRNAARRVNRPHRKPGPKPGSLEQDAHYYCGGCAGYRVVYCPDCIVGCPACKGLGKVACPACNGGSVPVQPPDYL